MKRISLIIWLCALLPGLMRAQTSAEAELASRYFNDGEYQSALDLYEKVYRREPEERYARRIVQSYENLMQYEEAISFLDKVIRKEKEAPIYPIIQAGLLAKTGDLKAADKQYDQTISKSLRSEGDFVKIGAYLFQAGQLNWALQTYQTARKVLGNAYRFSNEIANIHQQLGEFEAATAEYLNLYYQSPDNLSAANLDILNMASVSASAGTAIERTLLRAVDKYPNDLGLRVILYEFYVLDENFFEAFVQVKAIDRLFREDGERVFRFAKTMRNNGEYELSNQAFEYLIDKKRDSPYYFQAHFEKATNGELKAFETIPVDMLSVEQAVDDYGRLLEEFGRRPQYFEAIYRRARLMVFYLNDLDAALEELRNLLDKQQFLRTEDLAKAQLLTGDILLMKQEYNQAKLTYNEVAEAFKDRQLGALANFKLGQLAYYKGEFNLAQALLGAIKDNTSNDISNDAIKLNLTIIDNTGLDSTTTALEMFAQAQLLSYQRQYQASMTLLDSLAFAYPNHPLADEVLWEKTQIHLKQNDISTAMGYIDRLLEQFTEDIYGDDALYTKARIYDYNLKNPEAAMKYYLEFLTTYPGSLYSVQVRKRIRELRQG
jgi:tetratricopeptide (TPR) repeat protein